MALSYVSDVASRGLFKTSRASSAGPASAGPDAAHLNPAAANKAAAADRASAAKQERQSRPSPSGRMPVKRAAAGRSSYTTKDGRTVQATEKQSAAYQARIRN